MARQLNGHLFVRLGMHTGRGHIAKEINRITPRVRLWQDLHVVGGDVLALGNHFGQDTNEMPPIGRRLIVVVGDLEANAINHDQTK